MNDETDTVVISPVEELERRRRRLTTFGEEGAPLADARGSLEPGLGGSALDFRGPPTARPGDRGDDRAGVDDVSIAHDRPIPIAAGGQA